MGDVPQPPEPIKNSESLMGAANKESAYTLFIEELFNTKLPAGSRSNMPVTDIGQIKAMDLPSTWTAGTVQQNVFAADAYKEFNPDKDVDVKMCFYYRGIRTGRYAGEAFQKVLKEAPHDLSDEEYSSLQETLRNKDADYFTKTSARTEDINGKRVLVVEGSFSNNKSNQTDNKTIYVDSDGTGTAVQEIYFQAPAGKYKQYAADADRAFKSINWK